MKRKFVSLAVLCLIMIGMSTVATALPLPFNGTITPAGASSPGLAGAPLAYLSYNMTGLTSGGTTTWVGTLEQWVRKSSSGNLVFELLVKNTSAPGFGQINLVDMTDWNGYTTWADADATGVNPFSISRATYSYGSNVQASWLSGSGIAPGQDSGLLWIETDAQWFKKIGTTQIQGGGQASFSTFAPTTPEPATMVLFGLGMLGVGAGTLKRKRSKA